MMRSQCFIMMPAARAVPSHGGKVFFTGNAFVEYITARKYQASLEMCAGFSVVPGASVQLYKIFGRANAAGHQC
jgi:hypothetical protein